VPKSLDPSQGYPQGCTKGTPDRKYSSGPPHHSATTRAANLGMQAGAPTQHSHQVSKA